MSVVPVRASTSETSRLMGVVEVLVDRDVMADRLGMAVHAALVVRIKPGRRAVIRLVTDEGALFAKVRVGHRASRPFDLMRQFQAAGFGEGSPVAVATPFALFEDIEVWVQREAQGQPGHVVLDLDPCRLAYAAAEAAHRVHIAGVATWRHHSVSDELSILANRFTSLAARRPELGASLDRVLRAAERRAHRDLLRRPTCGVHRDYYHDQLLLAPDQVTVIDFDLYCSADPALDVGNFIAHLREHASRVHGDPPSMEPAVSIMADRYCDLAGHGHRAAIAAYAHLSLARHISLSTELADRHHTTGTLIDLCLDLAC